MSDHSVGAEAYTQSDLAGLRIETRELKEQLAKQSKTLKNIYWGVGYIGMTLFFWFMWSQIGGSSDGIREIRHAVQDIRSDVRQIKSTLRK